MDTSDTVSAAESVDKKFSNGYNANRGDTDGGTENRLGKRSPYENMGRQRDNDKVKRYPGKNQAEQKRTDRGWSVERRRIGDKIFKVVTEKGYTSTMPKMI